MSVYRAVLPGVSLLVMVVLALLPWGLDQTGRLAMALVPGLVVVYWSARPVRMLGPLSVFVCGLLFDVVSGAVLGHWAVVHLCALGASVVCYQLNIRIFRVHILVLPVVVGVMLSVIFGLSAFGGGELVPVWIGLGAGGWALLAYLVVHGVLWAIEGGREPVLEPLG